MSLLSIGTSLDSAAIVQAALRRLRESPYFFLKGIRCQVDRGVLTLFGHVPFGQLKSIAEVIVSRVEGVREVVNRIEVLDPNAPSLIAPRVRNAG